MVCLGDLKGEECMAQEISSLITLLSSKVLVSLQSVIQEHHIPIAQLFQDPSNRVPGEVWLLINPDLGLE